MQDEPFIPRDDGTLEVHLASGEADAIRKVAADIVEELDHANDPGLYRLFPPAYKDDPAREDEFETMTRDDLLARKRNAATTVMKSIDKGKTRKGSWSARLDEETSQAWLALVNDARLILGTRLNVTEKLDPDVLPPDHPDAPQHNLYLYLSALEWALVEALMIGLPPGEDD
jgi:hypothetical protein